jgi:hypothetical protein
MFCRKALRVLAGTLAHLFRITSADGISKGGRIIFDPILCLCRQGAATKTFGTWLEFSTSGIIESRALASPSLTLMFLLVPAQNRTCGV